MPSLTGRRVLLAAAESALAPETAAALAEARARLVLVALHNDADTAFTVQRLARKTGAESSQAIDGANDMAVRVMVRQVANALGGLDAIVACADNNLIRRYGEKELAKSGGRFLLASPDPAETIAALAAPADTR